MGGLAPLAPDKLRPCRQSLQSGDFFMLHMLMVLFFSIQWQIHEGGIRSPHRRLNACFSIDKRLIGLTVLQFTTNISTRSILRRLKSTEISFRSGLRPGPR